MHIKIDFFIPISPIIFVLGITVLVNLVLAYRVWIGNRRNPVNIYYGLAILMAAFWALSMLGVWSSDNPFLISLYAKFMYVSAALTTFFFWLFTYFFPYKTYSLSFKQKLVLLFSTFCVVLIPLIPNLFIPSAVAPEHRLKPEVSLFWHIVYGAYFLFLMGHAFWNLISKFYQSDGIWRKRLKQTIIATVVAAVGGGFFALIIPILYNVKYAWIGPLFTLFMASYIWYHIFWKTSHNKKI